MTICFKNLKECQYLIEEKNNTAFIFMPFSKDFDIVYVEGIKKAFEEANWSCLRSDETFDAPEIICTICKNIQESSLILADLTGKNPNVFLEVGLAFGLEKYVAFISQKSDDIPFDTRTFRAIIYDYNNLAGLKKDIIKFLKTRKTSKTKLITPLLESESEKRKIKRQNYNLMRERIYGPMLRFTNLILDDLKKIENHYDIDEEDEMKKVISDHLFSVCDKKIGNELLELMDRFDKYQKLQSMTNSGLYKIINEESIQILGIDKRISANSFLIILELADHTLSYLTYQNAVYNEIDLKEFIQKENKKWSTIAPLSIKFPSKATADLDEIEKFLKAILERTKSEKIFLEEKNQRINLLRKMEAFKEKISPFVDLT